MLPHLYFQVVCFSNHQKLESKNQTFSKVGESFLKMKDTVFYYIPMLG